jgi:hypothetical protein
VLLLSAEDAMEDTVKPRLVAAGADCSKVIEFRGHRANGQELDATIGDSAGAQSLLALERALLETGAELVCVDVLNAYLNGSVDAYRDQDVRRALRPLAQLAERTGCAIVGVRHLRKSSNSTAITAGAGSIGIGGAARSLLLVESDPEDSNRRVLAAVKSNVGLLAPSLGFRIEASGTSARIVWLGESPHDAESLTAARATLVSDRRHRSRIAECADGLRELLADGPVDRQELLQWGKAHDFSESLIERAGVRIDVVKRSSGFGPAKRSEWSLPPVPATTTNSGNPVTAVELPEMVSVAGNDANQIKQERAAEREAIVHENDPLDPPW